MDLLNTVISRKLCWLFGSNKLAFLILSVRFLVALISLTFPSLIKAFY